jgi:DNA modification methylase
MTNTIHKIIYKNCNSLSDLSDSSIQLIVTSPPYPMIEMWDDIFCKQDSVLSKELINSDPNTAFEIQHKILDQIWEESYRVLEKGCFLCINIGDATRTIDSHFRLFSNHSRITLKCMELGFTVLPVILWRKQTNAPNKFMGSGMLPAGAYVTLEHEYILIFRKGNKRQFNKSSEKQVRQKSGYFWEERNNWFSDIWDFKGIKQNLSKSKTRNRSGAYPYELAYRLINMYSVCGDIVLDPFLGTGTTTIAAMGAKRNSIGYEIDETFESFVTDNIFNSCNFINQYTDERVSRHLEFVNKRLENNYMFKYNNFSHNFPVMTKQEVNIELKKISDITQTSLNELHVKYSDIDKCNIINFESKIKVENLTPHQMSFSMAT